MDKNEIIKKIEEKGATQPCPRCGNNNFAIVDGYLNQSVQKEISGGLIIGGPSIPSVAVVCSNCGFISQHALGSLGLLPTKDDNNKTE